MAKLILIWALLFAMTSYGKASVSLTEVRQLFQRASTDESACRALIKLLEPFSEKENPVLSGYKGTAIMMMANYVFSPFTKLSYFKRGKIILEKAIMADKNSAELRFLRYSVQSNIPFFLGYKGQLDTDEKLLVSAINTMQEQDLRLMMTKYLRKTGAL